MNSGHVQAYIGIGSNLDAPASQLLRSLARLATLPETRLRASSRLYRTPPMGPPGQPWYMNAVAELETRLEPLVLLDHLQAIEKAFGRIRAERWGPRTLDLDLLVYHDLIHECPRLSLPHPGIAERAFVLYPLKDLAPDLEIPRQGTLSRLIEALGAPCPEAI